MKTAGFNYAFWSRVFIESSDSLYESSLTHDEVMAGVKTWLRSCLISALTGDEWLASRPGHSTCGEGIPLTIQEEDGWSPAPGWTFLETN